MWIYWTMLAIPSLFALIVPIPSISCRRTGLVFIWLFFTLIIGLRYEVGVDWMAYLAHMDAVMDVSFIKAMGVTDPGYAFFMWLSQLLGGGIYLVNLLCAAIFMYGVTVFSGRQTSPWLSLVVATPFMVIVSGINFTRQSAALGFVLLALLAIQDLRTWRFLYLIALGSLFHKTAVIMLPLAFFSLKNFNISRLILVGTIIIGIFLLILQDYYLIFWDYYVTSPMESEGGYYRVLMNAVPAFLLIIFGKKIEPLYSVRRLWIYISVICLICIILVSFASTAVDRASLYLMAIQLFVFSRIFRLFETRSLRNISLAGVIITYSFVLWAWLNFANHSFAWLPYQMFPFIN